METKLFKIDIDFSFAEAAQKASEILAAGGIIAFPTETVYGLGCNLFDTEAISKIYELKGRDSTKPMSAHVSSRDQARSLIAGENILFDKLMKKYLPGPLALIVKANETVPPVVNNNSGTIGIRYPEHPFFHELGKYYPNPLAGTSANLSGQDPAISAGEIMDNFNGQIDAVFDSGFAPIGLASTVLDISGDNPQILRQGSVHLDLEGM